MPSATTRTALLLFSLALGAPACGDDCEAIGQELAAASADAERCNPAAADPCTAFYTGCVYIGIDPAEEERLSTLVQAYKDAGCVRPLPCPGDVGAPAYVCQAGADGPNVCTAVQ